MGAGMAAKDDVGRRGEQLAAEFLEGQGLTIVSRNWRCREGELDIVAHDRRNTLVICEVKTRSGERFGSGAEAVTPAEAAAIRRLCAAVAVRIQGAQGPGGPIRRDQRAVAARFRTRRLRHIPGAF